MENTMEALLEGLKKRIVNDLFEVLPDIKVEYTLCAQTLTDVNYKYAGERAYPGMIEGHIWVHWDMFFDRVAGNGWMYGSDWIFKFDAADGTCKYDGYPATVTEAVEAFIEKQLAIEA